MQHDPCAVANGRFVFGHEHRPEEAGEGNVQENELTRR